MSMHELCLKEIMPSTYSHVKNLFLLVIGENFEQINTTLMRDTKTLYSLTRHGNKGFGGCETKSMCHMKYYGSYKTLSFVYFI